MDSASAGALLQCSKAPLGPCGKVILDGYLEEKRAFAADQSYCRRLLAPPLLPADRCRERRSGGRCRGRVSPIAACQLCSYHQSRRTGDKDIEEAQRALPQMWTQMREIMDAVFGFI